MKDTTNATTNATNKASRTDSKSITVTSGIKAGSATTDPEPLPWHPPVGDPIPPGHTLT